MSGQQRHRILSQSEMISEAARILEITEEEAKRYSEEIPELDALYVWSPYQEGEHLIIGESGTYLTEYLNAAGHDVLLEEYMSGKRDW